MKFLPPLFRFPFSRSCPMFNQIICCDCVEGMRRLPSGLVHLTVTSPPFDGLRDFDGWLTHFIFESIAQGLHRITHDDGGIVCWHVQNQIKKGSETGTAEMQKLYFRDLGFRLHNTIVIETNDFLCDGNRYGGAPQFVFVFTKGKPRVFHPLTDVRNKGAGQPAHYRKRDRHGNHGEMIYTINGAYRQRGNVWRYTTGKHHNAEGYNYEHPAVMHAQLVRDLVSSWSNPCDLVFDPMCGEGTTCTIAKVMKRHYLGMEINPYWVTRARQRVANTMH